MKHKKTEEYKPHKKMQFFKYSHLPDHLKGMSRQFFELALWFDKASPANPEKDDAMDRLVEAKDCAVRSLIWQDDPEAPIVEGDARSGAGDVKAWPVEGPFNAGEPKK